MQNPFDKIRQCDVLLKIMKDLDTDSFVNFALTHKRALQCLKHGHFDDVNTRKIVGLLKERIKKENNDLKIVKNFYPPKGFRKMDDDEEQDFYVYQYARSFGAIKNPSERVQLVAARNCGYVLEFIETPSEDVQIAAASSIFNSNVIFLLNENGIRPSEKVQMAAIQHGIRIESLTSRGILPNEEIQLEAISLDPFSIRYISWPSEKVQLRAVEIDSRTVRHIKKPTSRVLAAVELKKAPVPKKTSKAKISRAKVSNAK